MGTTRLFARFTPLVVAGVLLASCGNTPGNEARVQQTSTIENVQIVSQGNVAAKDITVRVHNNGQALIPLDPVMKALDLRSHWDEEQKMGEFGFTDPLYRVRVGDSQALSGDRTVPLPSPPVLINGKLHLTEPSISSLLNAPVTWNATTRTVELPRLTFENAGDGATTQSRANLSGTAVIQYGKKFLGVPYKFGTDGYSSRNRTFDCSSFTQHVYKNFGVNLPRSSRSQSDVGRRVSMNNLQPGDLMFFYTPGRYSSNRIVGHVGIYAGNNKILHTYGSPGVIMGDFNAHWKGRFLFGKRL
ncbi:NlpC/P60 family protein [Ammoniphilus sp. CFH 90114]|uniref:C40 family peptidase n=1 Tax=Ammoniphilus sp. CFH 90114 TaxID=2493665 RepID=UPI00100E94A7|nr:NlpC/P60 family protein [Ammoniphilus sp. CFH 90114]RXT15478.1 NlpC/P60 family protein [Ammoniphilus sp. CFH 90114]